MAKLDPSIVPDDVPKPREQSRALTQLAKGRVISPSRGGRRLEEQSITIRASVQLVADLKAAIARIEQAGGPPTLTLKALVVAALESALASAVALADAVEQKAAEEETGCAVKLPGKTEKWGASPQPRRPARASRGR